jgi:hypothetical protein
LRVYDRLIALAEGMAKHDAPGEVVVRLKAEAFARLVKEMGLKNVSAARVRIKNLIVEVAS